jgi:CheY-like chemotaxis protein
MPYRGPIIIVEDDMDDQEIMREIISDLGVPNILRFFNTCLKALEYLTSTLEKPFLIISDINLPIMNGLELKAEINGHLSHNIRKIPFIFMSTNRDPSMMDKALEVYSQGYFIKPTRLGDLKEMVRVILDYWRISSQMGLEK